jgi:hypothetical protein
LYKTCVKTAESSTNSDRRSGAKTMPIIIRTKVCLIRIG